ncbi:hypothetical protein PAERUG_P7_London_17_VIM_2_06_09_00408 [Pseudomonas aeruginosa]|nr:hypothetical protein PAERUG_P7_London_17_VIM_2_06_09_00408 [Pseudomonas aeruginosa]
MGFALDIHHLVARQVAATRLQELLQAGLGVLVGVHRGQLAQLRSEPGDDPLARGVHAGIQVDGADQGFHRIGEDRLAAEPAALQLARAQPQVVAHLEAARQQGQGLALDQSRAQARKLAFASLREVVEQRLADDEVENGVTEELQALVVAPGVAAMGQGQDHQVPVFEGIAELALESVQRITHGMRTRNSLSKWTTRSMLLISGSRFSYFRCARNWLSSSCTSRAFSRSRLRMPLICIPLPT